MTDQSSVQFIENYKMPRGTKTKKPATSTVQDEKEFEMEKPTSKRTRLSKVKEQVDSILLASVENEEALPKRTRGRPKKDTKIEETSISTAPTNESELGSLEEEKVGIQPTLETKDKMVAEAPTTFDEKLKEFSFNKTTRNVVKSKAKTKEKEENEGSNEAETKAETKKERSRSYSKKKKAEYASQEDTEKMEIELKTKKKRGKSSRYEKKVDSENKETKKRREKSSKSEDNKEDEGDQETKKKGRRKRGDKTPKKKRETVILPLVECKYNEVRGTGDFGKKNLKLSAWNINALRPMLKTTFLDDYIKESDPDVLCLQELKIDMEQLLQKKILERFEKNYNIYINCCRSKKGYSGILILTKAAPISVQMGMGIEKHDLEGRLIVLEYKDFYLIGVYVPNAGYKRQDYRTDEWDADFYKLVTGLKEKKEVIIIGDLNVSHTDLDFFDPVRFKGVPGFTDEERANFTKLLNAGFVDTFRHFYPNEKKWTYWNRWTDGREKGNGRRLDYGVVTTNLLSKVKDSLIADKVGGSDHCPVELHLEM